MPTKAYPGVIDAIAAALPDEEYFPLLARDPLAPWLTAIWASVRVGNLAAATDNFRLMFQGGLLEHYQAHPDVAKSEDATMIAQRMVDWRQANMGRPGQEPTWKKSLVRPKMLDLDLPLVENVTQAIGQQICPVCQELTCECETPRERLEEVGRMLERHINACPSGPERNALTEANIAIMVALGGGSRRWEKPKLTHLVAGSAEEPGEDIDPRKQ